MPAMNPLQKKACATLYSDLDLLSRRFVKSLESPFGMNIAQLHLWREKLVRIADLLDKAGDDARALLLDPAEFLESLGDTESLLDFAAVEYPPEEYRAQIDLREQEREAYAIRHAKEREILIKAGVIEEDYVEPADPEVEAISDEEVEAAVGDDDEVSLHADDVNASETGEGEGESFDPDADRPDFESGFTLLDEEGNAFPVPSLSERKLAYAEGYSLLQSRIQNSMTLLMSWVNTEAEVFRDDPTQALEPDVEEEAPTSSVASDQVGGDEIGEEE